MPEVTFFNVWQTDSKKKQQALVDAMRQETSIFQTAPGFLSLIIWAGEGEDHRVIAQGRWASEAAFQAAVADSPQANEGRARMARFGQPAPGIFHPAINLAASAAEPAR